MAFNDPQSVLHMLLLEAGYGSGDGQSGSEISEAVLGATTPGASRLQASQLQETSATTQRLQASRTRFGAPHISFGRFVLLLCSAPSGLGSPLLPGVFAFFPLFFFFFSPRPRCFLLSLVSGPECPGPWRCLPPCPPVPLFFFPSWFSAFLSWLVFVSCRPPFPPPPPPPLILSFFLLLPAWFGGFFSSGSFSCSPPPSPCFLFSFASLPALVFFFCHGFWRFLLWFFFVSCRLPFPLPPPLFFFAAWF